jgi:hypothetical protein
MRLGDSNGYALGLTVVGYQFPDASNPQQRYSWHMVAGEACSLEGTWTFRYPALTCDESPRVSAWLRAAADWLETGDADAPRARLPNPLTFTEPNLAFRAVPHALPGSLILEVDLDLEFQPPWRHRGPAGDPFTLSINANAKHLRDAATSWDEERAPYPDGLA